MKNLKKDARPFDRDFHPILGDTQDMVGDLTIPTYAPYEGWLKVGYVQAIKDGYHNN